MHPQNRWEIRLKSSKCYDTHFQNFVGSHLLLHLLCISSKGPGFSTAIAGEVSSDSGGHFGNDGAAVGGGGGGVPDNACTFPIFCVCFSFTSLNRVRFA